MRVGPSAEHAFVPARASHQRASAPNRSAKRAYPKLCQSTTSRASRRRAARRARSRVGTAGGVCKRMTSGRGTASSARRSSAPCARARPNEIARKRALPRPAELHAVGQKVETQALGVRPLRGAARFPRRRSGRRRRAVRQARTRGIACAGCVPRRQGRRRTPSCDGWRHGRAAYPRPAAPPTAAARRSRPVERTRLCPPERGQHQVPSRG